MPHLAAREGGTMGNCPMNSARGVLADGSGARGGGRERPREGRTDARMRGRRVEYSPLLREKGLCEQRERERGERDGSRKGREEGTWKGEIDWR